MALPESNFTLYIKTMHGKIFPWLAAKATGVHHSETESKTTGVAVLQICVLKITSSLKRDHQK